jgi:hypothetical protein
MTQQIIDIGVQGNDGTGDSIRTSFNKVNQNFTELYAIFGGGTIKFTNLSDAPSKKVFTVTGYSTIYNANNGSVNSTFTGAISGSYQSATLTIVPGTQNGTIAAGQVIAGSRIPDNTYITGGSGLTWSVQVQGATTATPLNVASEVMTTAFANTAVVTFVNDEPHADSLDVNTVNACPFVPGQTITVNNLIANGVPVSALNGLQIVSGGTKNSVFFSANITQFSTVAATGTVADVSQYNPNQVIMADTYGQVLTARTIKGVGGIIIDTSSNYDLVIESTTSGLIGDSNPILSASINARNGFTIGNLPDPSDLLVQAFNALPGNINSPTTIDGLAISKGYADSHYIKTENGIIVNALNVRAQPNTPQLGVSGYDPTLTGNYLSTEAMQRKDTVYRGGDTMTGVLNLSDHPDPMAGFGTPNSASDLQSATKFYVDNSTYYSPVNLYVSTVGDDLQTKTPAGREGRAWQYAYRTVGAAALQADNLISLAATEPGPYRQTITWTNLSTGAQTKSAVYNVTLNNGNSANQPFLDAANLLERNKTFIQYETIAYLNKKYVNTFTYDKVAYSTILNNIISAVSEDLALSSLDGTSLTTYNVTTQASLLFSQANSNIVNNQLTQILDAIKNVQLQITDYSYNTAPLEAYIGQVVDAITYDLIFGSNYQSIQVALGYSYASTGATPDQIAGLLDPTVININSLISDGATVTLSFNTQLTAPYVVGSYIIISGVNPVGYNGVYQVTDCTTSSLSYSNITTIPVITLGTIQKNNVISEMIDSAGVSSPTVTANLTSLANTITSIIKTGVVPTPVFPSLASTTVGQYSAANLLFNNIGFIQSELIAFVTSNYPSVQYSHASCERDIKYVVWSLIYDLMYGGNSQTVNAGLRYWVYAHGTVGGVLEVDPVNFWVSIYGYLQNLTQAIINNTLSGQALGSTPIATNSISTNNGIVTITLASAAANPFLPGQFITVAGVVPSGYNGTYVVTAGGYNTVSYVNSTTGAQTQAGTVTGTPGVLYQQTVKQYTNETYGGGSSVAVGLTNNITSFLKIIGSVGTLFAPIPSTLAGSPSTVTVGTPTGTLAIPVVYPTSYLASFTGLITGTTLTALNTVGIIAVGQTVLGNGVITTPVSTTITSVNTAVFIGYLSGTTLTIVGTPTGLVGAGMVLTESGITSNLYIVSGSTTTWTISTSYTLGTAQSPVTITGTSYTLNQIQTLSSRAMTTGDINRVAGLNIESINNASVSGLQLLATQFINTSYPVINNNSPTNTANILATINTLFGTITSLLTNGISSRTTPTFNTPLNITPGYVDFLHAQQSIIANIPFICAETLAIMIKQASTIGYLSSPSLDATVKTYLAYILEAIAYDLTYGSNTASVAIANSSWVNDISTISGLNQNGQAFWTGLGYALDIIKVVTQSTPGTAWTTNHTTAQTGPSPVTQVINSSWANITNEAPRTYVTNLIGIIRDIIAYNNATSYTVGGNKPLVVPSLSSVNSALSSTKATIDLQNSTIVTTTLLYLDTTYKGGFNYNEATCLRDLGLIIDAEVIDLLTGGNYQSVNAGKSYYKNVSAKAVAIGSQYTQTLDGITFAKNLALQILNQTTASRYQQAYTQVLDNTKNATGAIATFTGNYNIILNIISGGYGNAPTANFGSGIYTITFDNGATSPGGGNGYVDQGGNVTVGIQSGIHIIPGKILVGNVSGATGVIVSYQSGHDLGAAYDTITVRLTQPGFFIQGETLDFGETVPNLNITICVETGIYYEDYPIKVPANVTIQGDDFRRTIIRPLNRISQSPWRNTFFYRDSVIDAIQTGLIDFSTDYTVPAGTTATISGINSLITITLGNNVQALQSWIGYVFMDATSETGTAGKAVVLTVSGNIMNCEVIYPFAAIATYTIGAWHLYSTINYGRHYLTNPLDVNSVPKNNKEIDVFLCNDANRIRLITAQGHGGFMMVLDPTGQIKTKSPYAQESASFSGSLGTGRRFAGGQFIDGFTGRLSGTITAINNITVNGLTYYGKQITVYGAVNSGLDLRAPQVPCAFYVAGNRYQINDVVSWTQSHDINGNVTGGTVVLTLDNSTPFYLSGIYNTSSSNLSVNLAKLITYAGQDMAINVTAGFTGSIVGNTLTVTAVTSGTIFAGMYLSGTNIVQGTYITQSTGTNTWGVSYGYASTTGSQTITGILYSNYKTIVGGYTYLQPQNGLTSLGQLMVQQAILETETLVRGLSLTTADNFAINNNLSSMASIINNGVSSAPTAVFPGITLASTVAQKAANIIQNNKLFIQAELASWVTANYNIQSIAGYNSLVTQQDAGYLVDAITYDILYSGNSSVYDKALSYYYTNVNSASAQFTGSITGTSLTISGSVLGANGFGASVIGVGFILSGAGVAAGTTIVSGSGSSWVVNISQTVASNTTIYAGSSNYLLSSPTVYAAAYARMTTVIQQLIVNYTVSASNGNQYSQITNLPSAASAQVVGYITSNTLTVTSVVSGALAVNQIIVGNGIAANTYITGGSGTSWTVTSPNAASQTFGSSGSTFTIYASTVGSTIKTLTDLLIGYVVAPTSYSLPTRTNPTISNSDYTTLINNITSIQSTTLSLLNSGANLTINIEMGGNKSMLANDFTQVNDLGYGIFATNAALTEQVSTFTYYCYTAYWALNGAQIRSVAGSNANGQYGLRASGYDITELPNQVNLAYDMVQSAHVYKQGEFIGAMVKSSLNIYITSWQYIPQNTSEIEIDHTAVGGGIVRYEISTVSHTDVTINSQNVLNLTLSITGTDSTSTTGLAYPLYDGQVVTIRVLQNFKLLNINNVKPVRPSTALQFINNLNDIYRIISYNLIESTGEPFGLTSGIAILTVDSSFNFYKLVTDPANISNADPVNTSATATVLYGGAGNAINSYTLTIYSVSGSIAQGQVVGGVGFNGQTVSTVTGPTTVTVGGVTYTNSVYTVTLNAYPTVAPIGPVYFSTKTQGLTSGDTKIAIGAVTAASEINQLNKGIWVFAWYGRTHSIISYTTPTTIAYGTYATGSISSTTLIVTGVIGNILAGQLVTGTGFNGTQYVQSVTTTVVNSSINATIILTQVPTSAPNGTITFGVATNGYITIDPNPLYNNSAISTSTLAVQFVSQTYLPGSTTSRIATFNIPYNATSQSLNLPILPPVDSVLAIVGNSNTGYNEQVQVVGITNQTTIYVNSTNNLVAGMVVSSVTPGAVIPSGTIIQSVNTVNSSIVVAPACWVPSGTVVSCIQSATVLAITPNTSVGSGYTLGNNPIVIFSTPAGGVAPQRVAQAVATVNSDSIGSVNITIIDPGYGYVTPPTVTLSGGGGSLGTTTLAATLTSTPTATPTASSGVITSQMQLLYPNDPGTNGTVSATTNSIISLSGSSINSSGVLTVGSFTTGSISTGMILTGTGIAQSLTVPIMTITAGATTVTFTVPTTIANPFFAGQVIAISGVTPVGYNGYYPIASSTASTFSSTSGFINGTTLSLNGTITNPGNIALGASVVSTNIISGTYITAINTASFTGTLGSASLAGTVSITNTTGSFSLGTNAPVTLVTGQEITISGTSTNTNNTLSTVYATSITGGFTATSTTLVAGQSVVITGTATGNTYGGTFSLGANGAFTLGTAAGVTLTAGQPVTISGTFSTGSISGYVTGTTYYIIGTPTQNAFTISATYNGSAVSGGASTGNVSGVTLVFTAMSITGYNTGNTYYIGTTNGTTTFILLSSFGGSAITTTVGHTTGLTFTVQAPGVSGYSNNTTYLISATNGTNTFTLQTLSGGGITTTVGTLTGLSFAQLTNTLAVTNVSSQTQLSIGMVISGTNVTPGTYISAYGSGNGGTGTYTLNQFATGTPTTGTSYTVNQSQTAASGTISGSVTTVTYNNSTNSSVGFVAGAGSLTSNTYTYISSNISGTGAGSTWQTTTNTGVNYAVSSTTITGTANLLTISNTAKLYVGNQLTFGGNVALGGLSQSTTYYILGVTGSSLLLSASLNGPSVTVSSQTALSGQNMTYNSPSFGVGTTVGITGTPVVTPVTVGNVTTYSVAFTITSSLSVTNGAYYYVGGNSNTLYNGYFPTSTTTGTVAANGTLTLTYQFNPNGNSSTWGASTPSTITANTTSGTSSTLGLAKPFTTGGSTTIRAGYPAGTGGQITVRISTCRATGHDFLDIGTGGFDTTNYPNQIYGNPIKSANAAYAVVEEGVGRVFHVSTDQNGIFRVGRFFEVDQGTGTVTFSASIALSNLDGLGFKRGVVVSSFSTDSTMTENAPDIVPVQSAVRGYIDLRLGLDASSNPIAAANLIGPGFLPLNGGLAMKNTMNMGNNYIQNLLMPTSATSPSDAANRGYVDAVATGGNSIFKLKDVAVQAQATYVSLTGPTLTVTNIFGTILIGMSPTTATGSYFSGQTITQIATSGANTILTLSGAPSTAPSGSITITFNNLASGNLFVYDTTLGQWTNVAQPSGTAASGAPSGNHVALTFTHGTPSTVTATIVSNVIVNSMVNTSAAIAQSKLALQAAGTLATAPVTYTQSSLGLAAFNISAFSSSNGWIDLANSTSTTTGILYSKIQYMGANTVIGNNTGSSAAPTELTFSQVISGGGGVFSANFTGSGVFTQTGQGAGYSITPVTTAHGTSSIIKSDSSGNIDVVGIKVNGYGVISLNADGVTLQLNTPASASGTPVYFMTAAGTTTSNTITTFTGTVDVATTNGTLLARSFKTNATDSTVTGSVTGNWSVLANSIWDTTAGTLKSNSLTAVNSTSSSPASITGYWKLASGSNLDATQGTLISLSLSSGLGTGTISGAWGLGSGVTLNQNSGSIIQTALSTGLYSTAGTVTGNWSVGTNSTFIATSIKNQANSATIASTSANTASTIVSRDASGNFSAGTITATLSGSATTAGSVTGQANSATITASVINVANNIVLRDGSNNTELNSLYAKNLIAGTIASNSGATTGQIQGTWTLTGSGSQLQATYSDLAEWYTSDAEYEPGTVLVFGGSAETTTTTQINDTRSAGIVTTDPAYTMNHDLVGTKVCIALVGRVPCKVIGRVKKGDMLTTSATPGYAIKALTPTLGAIIGKALEDKDYGEAGVIEVAVGRA